MNLPNYQGYSFGSLLRRFRARAHLTQRRVAEVVGVHRNVIGRWEQGEALPRSKGIVLELSRRLFLDEQETRQLLEASLTALAPHWYVPYHRNPYFTGREALLSQLHTCLRSEGAVAQIQALSGLGGIGKTQLALEYAYRHALDYSAIFWIEADSVESITRSMLAISDLLYLPGSERQETEKSRMVEVQRWLTTHKDWLLIWDNVEDLNLLTLYLPKVRSGVTLLTTRMQALGTLALHLQIETMRQEEGMLLLLRRAALLPSNATSSHLQLFATLHPAQDEAAKALVQAMGGLPLALDQAGAYIDETGFRLSDYLRHYEQHRLSLLARRGTLALDHPQSVATTFRLSYEHVRQMCPAAANLLKVCAFLAPEIIPAELFVEQAIHLKSETDEVAVEDIQFDLALATLRRLSLVQYHPESQTLSIHRLIQVVLQDEMSKHEQLLWQRKAVHALNKLFPEHNYQVWEPCERLLPHVLKMAATSLQEQALAELVRKAADYLLERAKYEQAEQLYLRALQMGEQVMGSEHPQIVSALTSLAILYREQGKYEQAEQLFLRALSIKERLSDRNHSQMALILTNLGQLYWKLGKYNEAASLHQQARQISEELLGPEHPELAAPFLNLALVYWKLGKYRQAEPLCQRAITLWERAYGPKSPILTFALTGLGLLYVEQRRYAQAEQLFLRVLSLREQIWGAEHPYVARAFLSLAYLATKQGSFERARALYKRCLQMMEQFFGPRHPYIADVLYGLATVYNQQDNYQRAEPFYTRALAIREQSLGIDHPETAECLADLRRLTAKQGRHEQASLTQDTPLLTVEQVRTTLKRRGWTVHLKRRRARVYVYATRRVGKRTQSRYLAPLDDLTACLRSALALPNTAENDQMLGNRATLTTIV